MLNPVHAPQLELSHIGHHSCLTGYLTCHHSHLSPERESREKSAVKQPSRKLKVLGNATMPTMSATTKIAGFAVSYTNKENVWYTGQNTPPKIFPNTLK